MTVGLVYFNFLCVYFFNFHFLRFIGCRINSVFFFGDTCKKKKLC